MQIYPAPAVKNTPAQFYSHSREALPSAAEFELEIDNSDEKDGETEFDLEFDDEKEGDDDEIEFEFDSEEDVENDEDEIFEGKVDLGYTDNYQKKTVMTLPSDKDDSDSRFDDGAPKGGSNNKKRWVGTQEKAMA